MFVCLFGGTPFGLPPYSLPHRTERGHCIKDYFFYQGNSSITGSRDATREAFTRGLVTDGEGWMEMIVSRNKTSHTYNQAIADDIADRVVRRYHLLFLAFLRKMQAIEAETF